MGVWGLEGGLAGRLLRNVSALAAKRQHKNTTYGLSAHQGSSFDICHHCFLVLCGPGGERRGCGNLVSTSKVILFPAGAYVWELLGNLCAVPPHSRIGTLVCVWSSSGEVFRSVAIYVRNRLLEMS